MVIGSHYLLCKYIEGFGPAIIFNGKITGEYHAPAVWELLPVMERKLSLTMFV
jgi:hypothetical protein